MRYLEFFSDNKEDRYHGLGQCITEFAIREWHDIDFCSKVSCQFDGKMIIIRDPKKMLTHSNFHRYCSELAYMPYYLHSEYVGTSILHEIPGLLAKEYGELRMRQARIL